MVEFKNLTSTDNKKMALLAALMLASSILVYLPFLKNFDIILRHYDGPLYVYVAKTFYFQQNPFGNQDYIYSSQLIGYPMLIRLFSPIGYFNSMLFVTLMFSVLSVLIFFYLLKEFKYVKNPFFIALVFIFLPPRWLKYHSIGASEPVFIFFLLASFYYFKKAKYGLSAACGFFSTLTRINGIILFPAYILLMTSMGLYKKTLYLLSIPLALLLNLYMHYKAYGDFFAYFKWNIGLISLENFLPINYPFHSILSEGEITLLIFFVYGLAIARLYFKKQHDLALISLAYITPLIFIVGGDKSRFLIPLTPFTLIAFEDIIDKKEFKLTFLIFIILIYFYNWSHMDRLMSINEYESLKKIL